jgi:repressor LexA
MTDNAEMAKDAKTAENQVLFDRLKSARKSANLTQAAMATRLGVSRDTYSKYESRTVIPNNYAMKAAKALGVDWEYLVSPESIKQKLPSNEHNAVSVSTGTIPIFVRGAVQAGLFREALEWPRDDWETMHIPGNLPYADKELQALKVCGASMNAWYPDGSYIVFVPTIQLSEGWLPATGQHVLVQRTNEWGEVEATVKEVAYEGKDLLLWPRSDDPAHQKPWRMKAPKHIDPDDTSEPIRVTGLVVWAFRRSPGV